MHKRHRLRHRRDIAQVRETGQSRRHPLAVLLFRANEQAVSRFAFSASQHVGKAVARNRAKRLLREAVRLHLAEIQAGWDCMFIARRQTATASLTDVEVAVLRLFERAQLLAPSSDEQAPPLSPEKEPSA
jgi:ribonuclease P protein component